jgi:hypothetical protein
MAGMITRKSVAALAAADAAGAMPAACGSSALPVTAHGDLTVYLNPFSGLNMQEARDDLGERQAGEGSGAIAWIAVRVTPRAFLGDGADAASVLARWAEAPGGRARCPQRGGRPHGAGPHRCARDCGQGRD